MSSMNPNSDPPLLKQEKAFGNLALALGGVGGAVGLYFALPFLLTLAWGVTQLAVLGSVLFVLFYLFTSDLVRTHGAKIFRMSVRKTSRIFMAYDPIGALQDHVLYLRASLGKFDEKRNTLSGIIENMKTQIARASEEYAQSMRLANKAREMEDVSTLRLEGNKARRRKETVERLTTILDRLVSVLKTLHKLREQANFLILDTEDEVNELVTRSSAMHAAGTALEEALKILEGDPEMAAMYKDTVRTLEENVRERVGLIEMVMSNADGLIGGIDVKNATVNDQILRDLEAWDLNAETIGLRPEKRAEAAAAGRDPEADMKNSLRAALASRAQAETGRKTI